MKTETLPFGLQLSCSINPRVTAELTHSAVHAFRQKQVIPRPVGDYDRWQPLSDEVNRDSMAGKPGKPGVQPIQSHGAIPVYLQLLIFISSEPYSLSLCPLSLLLQCSSLAFSQSFPLDTSHPLIYHSMGCTDLLLSFSEPNILV